LKDVIATDDRMQTTAGSLALLGSKVPRDAGVARMLRDAGAILLGKNNMSEWNAFRGWPTLGGWSGRAGMGRNPYALSFSTGDSSSGSAASVAAGLAPGAVGLETYGSIVMPSSLCGVVGLKPTHGLTSRSGTIPISFSRDVLGPIGRTVADVATLLSGLEGVDPRDELTRPSARHLGRDYTRALRPDGLRGVRLGVWRSKHLWSDAMAAEVIEEALVILRDLGAVLVDPIELPTWGDATGEHVGVMMSEFEEGINRYLRGLVQSEVRSLADVIAFNQDHRTEELRWHNDGIMASSVGSRPLPNPPYLRSLELSRRIGRQTFGRAMREHRLDAIVAPTFVRPWLINMLDEDPYVGNGAAGPSNAAGYPHITVPAGFAHRLPIGMSFMARAWEEPKLFRYAYAFEQADPSWKPPTFLDDSPAAHFVDR
jgi:amidase